MAARRYTVAGRTFTKVAASGTTHVVEEGNFWQGERSWQHRTLCGQSITGTPVSLQRLTCAACRAQVERLGALT